MAKPKHRIFPHRSPKPSSYSSLPKNNKTGDDDPTAMLALSHPTDMDAKPKTQDKAGIEVLDLSWYEILPEEPKTPNKEKTLEDVLVM